MDIKREFFPKVKKTIMPRPYAVQGVDILGQSGTAWATEAAIYGTNWHVDRSQGLVEIYGAGAAIGFQHLLPHKAKYEQEGLYLRLKLAYRTTANANVNIRNFSGNHVDLPNSYHGDIYDDPATYCWVTDDLTLNVNSIYTGEKIWFQRVDWEWMSKDVVYDDEIHDQPLYVNRSEDEIQGIYAPQAVTPNSIKQFLIEKIQTDEVFAKRALALLQQDRATGKDLTELFLESGMTLTR
jgi:hypothetical protein